ncbi:unnamed protein product, partial [Meganyctiphanes norvegica]
MDKGKTDGGRDRETSSYAAREMLGGTEFDTTRYTRIQHTVYNASYIVKTSEQAYLNCKEEEEERCSLRQCSETYLVTTEASLDGVKNRSSLEELVKDRGSGTMGSLGVQEGKKRRKHHGSSKTCSLSQACFQTKYAGQNLVPAAIGYLSSFWRKTRWQLTVCIFLGLLSRAETLDLR